LAVTAAITNMGPPPRSIVAGASSDNHSSRSSRQEEERAIAVRTTTKVKRTTSAVVGKAVIPNEKFGQQLEQIIQRDYFPHESDDHDDDNATECQRSSSSLSQFLATSTSSETAALDAQQKSESEARRQHHERWYAPANNSKKHTTSTTLSVYDSETADPQQPAAPFRNALFFPLEDKEDGGTRDSESKSNNKYAEASPNSGETNEALLTMEPHKNVVSQRTVDPTATRFPMPLARRKKQHSEEIHWEGSDDDDEEDSVATDLDAESVAVSLPTEIRLGQLRQQQAARDKQRNSIDRSSSNPRRDATIQFSFRLPPQSGREQSAGAVLEERRKQIQQQLTGRTAKPTVRASKSPSKAKRKPPPVRSSDSFGFALRAAYTPSKKRRKMVSGVAEEPSSQAKK